MVLQIADAPVTKKCCHHWVIETAYGPDSVGMCKNCLETREFKNSIDDWSFDNLPQERKTTNAPIY